MSDQLDFDPPPDPDDEAPDDLYAPLPGDEPDGGSGLAAVMELLTGEVEVLVERVSALEQFLTDLPVGGPWCWRHLDRDQTRQLAEELRDWVDWLISRYRLANIPPCWFRHGNYVEELTALFVAWKAAYNPKVSLPNDHLINWHDRWFRPCMERLTAPSCMNGQHQEPGPVLAQTDLDDFDTWLAEQDHAIPEHVPDKTVATSVASDRAQQLLKEDASPVQLGGQWWSRRREGPRRLTPDWSRRDQSTGRRLDQLLDQRPIDPATGAVSNDDDHPDWVRRATLAARGLGLIRERKSTPAES